MTTAQELGKRLTWTNAKGRDSRNMSSTSRFPGTPKVVCMSRSMLDLMYMAPGHSPIQVRALIAAAVDLSVDTIVAVDEGDPAQKDITNTMLVTALSRRPVQCHIVPAGGSVLAYSLHARTAAKTAPKV